MSTSIKQLVDRGLELRARLKALKEELDQIQERLCDAALWREHVALKESDREGRRYLARGTAWVVPVIFTADKLLGRFQDGSPAHQRLQELASRDLIADFFELQRLWCNRFDDGLKFRKRAAEKLQGAAPQFISACLARDRHGIPRSDIKIAWDEAEQIAAVQVQNIGNGAGSVHR